MTADPLVKVLYTNMKKALKYRAWDEAAEIMRRLKDDDPLSVTTRGFELELLIATQSHTEAATLLAQLLNLFPNSPRIHFLAGRLHYQNKAYSDADLHLRESERLHPHWLTRRLLGQTQTQLGAFPEAESLLAALVPEHPEVGSDLAWLYERRELPAQALRVLEDYLKRYPRDRAAQAQRLRLQANNLAPDELLDEVQTLLELGESVPGQLLTAYVQRLLETGQGSQVRQFIQQHHSQWEARTSKDIAWVCHRLQAYDLAYQLFLAAFQEHIRDFKYLSAMEAAALRCNRTMEVIQAYEPLTAENKNLFGRIKRLQKRLPTD